MTLLSPQPTYAPVSSCVNGGDEQLRRPHTGAWHADGSQQMHPPQYWGEPSTGRAAFSVVAAVRTEYGLEGDVQRAPDQREATAITVLVTNTPTATKPFFYSPTHPPHL